MRGHERFQRNGLRSPNISLFDRGLARRLRNAKVEWGFLAYELSGAGCLQLRSDTARIFHRCAHSQLCGQLAGSGSMLMRARLRSSCLTRPWSQSLLLTHRQRRVEHYSSAATQAQVEASNDAFFAGNATVLPSTHPLAHLRSELTSRPYAITIDVPTHIPSNLLHKTLFDFLPKSYHHVLFEKRASTSSVPPGYHLIHFPPSDPLSALQSDGTDPAHSPGPPFNRRMWAGGFMHFYRDIPFDCRTRECVEKLANVEVRGKEGEEKVFVLLKRWMSIPCR